MKRRLFLQGSAKVLGGLFLAGKEVRQEQPEVLEPTTELPDEDGPTDLVLPGFVMVSVDGERFFRMDIGDTFTAEHTCRLVVYNGFDVETRKCFYLMSGDTFNVV